jgi:hypothetical protein
MGLMARLTATTNNAIHHFPKPHRNQNARGRMNNAKRNHKKSECREEKTLIDKKVTRIPAMMPNTFKGLRRVAIRANYGTE